MKLQYNDLNLKTKRAFSNKFFKDHNITFDNIDHDKLITLNTFLSEDRTSERRAAFYQMLISETTLEKDLLLRYEKYVNTPLHTELFYRLKFGDSEGTNLYHIAKNKRGYGNTLKGHIVKFGLEEGTKLYNERNSKRAHTLDNFIRLYGEINGPIKYKSAIDNKGGCKLENMVALYGETEGEKRWNDWKDRCKSSEENFIKRHGEELGKQKWQEFKDKAISSEKNFIRRHGKVEGKKKYKQFCQRSANTKENFIRVHGLEEGEKRWNDYKNSNAGYKASKESLDFFEPITKHLLNMGVEMEDIWFGGDDSMEFKIENGDKLYSYDYTILSKKIIIEFNGNHVHPSKELLGENWDSWRCAWSGETADQKHSQDMEKLKIAEKEGFTVIEVWDFKDKNESLEKCIKIVEERF